PGFALPDAPPVAVRALYGAAQYDSIQARARATADSLRRAKDTTARRDTTGRPAAAAQRPPAAAGAARPARVDTSAARLDTTRVRKLLKQRPVPSDRLVVQTAQPLTPGGKSLVRVRGARALSGAAPAAQGVRG